MVNLIILDWCFLGNTDNECSDKNENVTITIFALLYEVVLCLLYILSFYCGAYQCKEKFEIFTHIEKIARTLNCTENVIVVAKKTDKLFVIIAWPGILFMVVVGLASLEPFSYFKLYRQIIMWIGITTIFIWEWKYIFYASVQCSLFDQLNSHIQVTILNCPVFQHS
jgi:hypothetical protein